MSADDEQDRRDRWVAMGIRTDIAHPARIYNYHLGGKDNFAADREMGDFTRQRMPQIVDTARSNRQFHGRAVRFLRDNGIRQFLDIGTGLPISPNTHEIAADARIVYVDNDPVVFLHAEALMADHKTTRVVRADLRDVDEVLAEAGKLLDFSEPVGLLFIAVLHNVADADDPAGIAARYLAAVAPGSYLVISHLTDEFAPEKVHEITAENARRGSTFIGRSKQDITAMFNDLELVAPGVVPVSYWRPEGGQPPYNADRVWGYSGVARVPGGKVPDARVPGGSELDCRKHGARPVPVARQAGVEAVTGELARPRRDEVLGNPGYPQAARPGRLAQHPVDPGHVGDAQPAQRSPDAVRQREVEHHRLVGQRRRERAQVGEEPGRRVVQDVVDPDTAGNEIRAARQARDLAVKDVPDHRAGDRQVEHPPRLPGAVAQPGQRLPDVAAVRCRRAEPLPGRIAEHHPERSWLVEYGRVVFAPVLSESLAVRAHRGDPVGPPAELAAAQARHLGTGRVRDERPHRGDNLHRRPPLPERAPGGRRV